MVIELNAKCGNCGYNQILKGFEKILKANENNKMRILKTHFLLIKQCERCNNDYCYRCSDIDKIWCTKCLEDRMY